MILFIAWFFLCYLLSIVATNLNLPADTSHNWIPTTPWEAPTHEWLKPFATWDAGYYFGITEQGYYLQENGKTNATFFPLYPLLITIFHSLTGLNTVLLGVVISVFFALASSVVMFKLALLELKNAKSGFLAVAYLLFFPTAFFLVSMYSESIFLFLALLSFYCARRQQWGLACLAGFFTTATRPIGLIILFALIIEYLDQINFQLKKIKKNFLLLPLIAGGLGGYMLYLFLKFDAPLLFLTGQTNWSRLPFSLVAPFAKLASYAHDFFTLTDDNWRQWMATANDFVFFILALILGILAFFLLRKSYGIYALLGILVPFLTNTLISLPRFVLVLFPLPLLLAKFSTNPAIKIIIFAVFIPLFIIYTILISNWYWVA